MKSFEIKTNKALYKCLFVDTVEGDEHWDIQITYGQDVTESFRVSKSWARTRIFQFVDSIDEKMW